MQTPDFGRLAATYDQLRPRDDELIQAFVAHGDLLSGRVLDTGCGTGTLVAWLAERGVRVFGVDANAEMLEVARSKAPRAGLKLATAEALPFRDGWFDRVAFQLSVHLLDRPRAFAEALRVLVPAGRVAIATFEQEHFERFYLNGFFPSLAAIDRARFPTRRQLSAELEDAGFAAPVFQAFAQHVQTPRTDVLDRIRARHISTLELLPPDEHAAGLARAERELPELVESSRLWLFASATAPG